MDITFRNRTGYGREALSKNFSKRLILRAKTRQTGRSREVPKCGVIVTLP